ncbi:MAG: hypothetical protein ACLTZB_01785 [Streptococcus salivarius]
MFKRLSSIELRPSNIDGLPAAEFLAQVISILKTRIPYFLTELSICDAIVDE